MHLKDIVNRDPVTRDHDFALGLALDPSRDLDVLRHWGEQAVVPVWHGTSSQPLTRTKHEPSPVPDQFIAVALVRPYGVKASALPDPGEVFCQPGDMWRWIAANRQTLAKQRDSLEKARSARASKASTGQPMTRKARNAKRAQVRRRKA